MKTKMSGNNATYVVYFSGRHGICDQLLYECTPKHFVHEGDIELQETLVVLLTKDHYQYGPLLRGHVSILSLQ